MPFHWRIPSPSTTLDLYISKENKPQVKNFLLNFYVSNQLTMLFKEKQIEFKHNMAFMELIKNSLL